MPKYATLARLKSYMDITDTASDTKLNELLDATSSLIADYCKREFAEAVLTEDSDGDGGPSALVSRPPLLRVDEVYDDPDRNFTAATKLNASDYIFYEHGEVRRVVPSGSRIFGSDGGFARARKSVRVKYLGGYTLPGATKIDSTKSRDLPESLIQVTVELAAHLFRHPDGRTLRWQQAGDSQLAFTPVGIPEGLAKLLVPWRLERI